MEGDGSVYQWDETQVCIWLQENGFEKYASLLCDKHKIDGSVLMTLSEADLRQPPLQISVLGDIKRLMICISRLQSDNEEMEAEPIVTANHSRETSDDHLFRSEHRHRRRRKADRLDSITESIMSDDSVVSDTDLKYYGPGQRSKELDREIWKTVLSFVYVFTVFLLTSFVMVIVHDRVPDMEKYPPLPDIFLDNMPYVSWAFSTCEMIGLVLAVVWHCILFFHKHRFILMRRFFSLMGTMFLLRCITMLITSLSVPGQHLQCGPKSFGDFWSKLDRAIVIWKGLGMTLHGVRSCGDYMFSGHTVALTMMNFFITEYSPRRMHFLHTFSWIMNLFGIFFILCAHEHYSIDVFIAFYLTSRLFLYYHTLANNRALMQQDRRRTRVWFPLFSFFESRCDGIVPNEYEWPLPWPKPFKKWCDNSLKRNGKKW